MDISSQIEEMLDLPYWIIDILPRQVPAEGGGQYFSVEQYILNSSMMDAVCQRFARLLLKINCYEDIAVCLADADEWTDNPSPQTLAGWFLEQKPMNILLKSTGAMVAFSGDDHSLTYYTDRPVPQLIRDLTASENLFVWKPESQEK